MNSLLHEKLASVLHKIAYGKAKARSPMQQAFRIKKGKSATAGQPPAGITSQGVKGAQGMDY